MVTNVKWNPNSKNFVGIDKGASLVFVYPQSQFFDQQSASDSQMMQM
jgi:hypothetical protein